MPIHAAIRALGHLGRTLVDDVRRRDASAPGATSSERITAGLDWLSRAQDHGDDRGFSYGYTIKGGWQPSYVETTGYIICTFLNAAGALGRVELTERAIHAGDWLRGVQLDDGSFTNPNLSAGTGLVFDTGQDLHGLLDLAQLDDGLRFETAAHRAARWLVDVTDSDGCWTRNTFNRIPHVYNTRVAWALLRAGHRFDDREAVAVAEANLKWACTQQLANGWFDNCAFAAGAPPFTHTTAYAGRGLLEAGLLLGDDRFVDAARRVAEAATRHLSPDGRLPGRISIDDEPVSTSSCLTGSAQFAIIWLKLADLDGGDDWRAAAMAALDYVGRSQSLDGPPEIRGAIKGSDPVWGRYAPLGYPNWATKFFVDGLLLAERTTSR